MCAQPWLCACGPPPGAGTHGFFHAQTETPKESASFLAVVTDLSELVAQVTPGWAISIPGRKAAHRVVRKFIQREQTV